MKSALVGVVAGAATAVILGAAQIVAWVLMAEHYDDDPWDVT